MVALASPAVHPESSPTDLTDEQWEMLRPYVEVQTRTGPKQWADLRAVLNGLLYKLKSGCQ
jgi:putative transposase